MKFKLAAISSFILFGCANAQADIVANFATPPVVTQLAPASGGTIIKINPANQNGVSINSYSAFDIEPQGVLLSNNTAEARSTQGFNIEANDRLDGRSATVIINEVFSQDATQLSGPAEVVGNRADVIVVNPSGIICNGCGFINTNNATLTTARYSLGNGGLSYSVASQAPIHITGSGLFDRTSKNVNLITKSVSLTAPINVSNTLNIITGNNMVSNDLRIIQGFSNGLGPDVYVTSAGGMYANNINIVSTRNDENAFFNDGNIVALNNLTLNANGNLNNGTSAFYNARLSSLHGNTIINLNQNASLNNSGSITAKKDIHITVNRGSVNNNQTGSIVQTGKANGSINITAESINNNSMNSRIESYGSIMLQSNQFENNGRITALNELDVVAKDSNNIHNRRYYSTFNNGRQGKLDGGTIRILQFDLLNSAGDMSAADAVVLRANNINYDTGSTVFARNTFDLIANTKIEMRARIQVGIRNITPTYYEQTATGRYFSRNWFFDANRAKRRFNANGSTVAVQIPSESSRRVPGIRW